MVEKVPVPTSNCLRSVCLFALLGGLAACSRGPISAALPSDIDPQELAQRIQRPAQVTGRGGAVLRLEPGYVGACKGWDRGTSKISWKVDPAKVNSVRVEVEDRSKGTRQVFAGGSATGEATAEGWFSADVIFHVINATSNSELVSYPVEALNCARP